MPADDLSLDDLLKTFSEAYLTAEGKMGRFNVLIIGKTGVGKSTLINAVFREPLARIGSGKPVTQDIRRYIKDDFPITVYDTPGLELAEEQIQRVKLDVSKLIDDQQLFPISEHIHVIWYCISHEGKRLEHAEKEWLQELEKKDLPVLLVLTKTISRKPTDFITALKAENLPVRQIIPILAEPIEIDETYTVKAHGLDLLVEITFELLPEVARKAFVNGTQNINLKAKEAAKYVAGYVASAFAVGATPIPFADSPILVTMQTTMLAHITLIFGLPFTKGFVSMLLSTIAGSGGMSLIGRSIVSNLLKLVPGAGTILGGAIAGSTAAALTMALGLAYIESLRFYMRSQLAGKKVSWQDLAKRVQQEYTFYVRSGRRDLRQDDESGPRSIEIED